MQSNETLPKTKSVTFHYGAGYAQAIVVNSEGEEAPAQATISDLEHLLNTQQELGYTLPGGKEVINLPEWVADNGKKQYRELFDDYMAMKVQQARDQSGYNAIRKQKEREMWEGQTVDEIYHAVQTPLYNRRRAEI